MANYTVLGIEEVYDAFDDYEHANALPPLSVQADSVEQARAQGLCALQEYAAIYRTGLLASGTFVPRVLQIADEAGYLVFQDSRGLVHGWPFPSDERCLLKEMTPPGSHFRLCFIAYSRADDAFARCLYDQLLRRRYLCWFAPENPAMPTIGFEQNDVLKRKIEEGIRSARIVLCVISNHSLSSAWVGFEVDTALHLRRAGGKPLVVGLGISPVTAERPWFADLRAQNIILDFSNWRAQDWLDEEVARLVQYLNASI